MPIHRLGSTPRINWSHPLAKDLVVCIVPDVGDLLTGTPPIVNDTTNCSIATTALGRGVRQAATAFVDSMGVSYALPAWSPLWSTCQTAGQSISWFVYADRLSLPSAAFGGHMFSIPQAANSVSHSLAVRSQSFSNPSAWPARVTNTTAGQGEAHYITSETGYWNATPDPASCYAGSLLLGNTVGSVDGAAVFYKNGALFGTATVPYYMSTIDWNTRQPLVISALSSTYTTSSEQMPGNYGLLLLFGRVLSAAEHAMLSADPWQLIEEGNDSPLVILDFGGGGPASYTASISDSVAPSGALARALVAARALADSVGPSDAVSRIYGPVRGLADSVAPSGAVGRVLVAARALADVVAPSDAVARAIVVARALADSVAPSDAAARALAASRGAGDTVAPSGALARQATLARGLADSVSPSDSVGRLLVAARALADSISAPTDAVGYTLIGQSTRSISDSITTPSDSVARALVAARSIVDAVTAPTDAATRAPAYQRSTSDSITAASDAVARAPAFARALADAVGLPSDAVARALVAARAAGDSVAPSGSVARLEFFARALADAVGAPTDAVDAALSGSRTRNLADVVGAPSDSVARALVAARNLGDAIGAPTDDVLAGFVVVLLAISFAVQSRVDITIEVQQVLDIDLEVKP